VSHGNPNRPLFNNYKASQDHYLSTTTVAIESLPDSLPEVVLAMLAPLYELFDFFSLPKRLVEEELREMSRNTFAM